MASYTSSSDDSRVPSIMVITWLETSLAIIFIILRFYSRYTIRALAIDDWVMLASVLLFTVSSCLVTYLASVGGFKHFDSLTPEQQYLNVKWNWITQPFYIFNFGLSILATGLVLFRLLSPSAKKRWWTLYIALLLTNIGTIVGTVFIFVHCDPPRALWDPDVHNAKCANTAYSDWSFFISAWYIFMDFFLAVFPITMVWNLKLSIRKRVSVILLLGQGIFAGVVGCIKMPHLSEVGAGSDMTWDMYPLFALTMTEIVLVIYAGCIPTLKPLYDRMFPSHKTMSPAYGSGESEHAQSSGNRGVNDIRIQRSYAVESMNNSAANSDNSEEFKPENQPNNIF